MPPGRSAEPVAASDDVPDLPVARDLTERAEMERELRATAERLREAEERFRTLVERLPVVTYASELHFVAGSYDYVSPGLERLVGYTQEDWYADDDIWLRLVHEDDRAAVEDAWGTSVVRGREPFSAEYRMRHKDGRIIWVLDQAQIVMRDGVPHIEGMFQDVTERHEAEAANLRQAAELAAANERLVILERLRSEFFVTASHELRTPLTSVLGFATTLATLWDQLEDRERQDFVRTLQRQGRRLLQLVEDLTAIAAMDAGEMRGKTKQLQLAPMLRRIADDFAPTPGAISVEADPHVWALADPGWLRRILESLLSNALRYGAEPIEIAAGYAGSAVEIRVRDHGPGVPDDLHASLFERFALSEEQEQRIQQGFGVGLSVARDLARAMDGELAHESTAGGGASFCLRVPAVVAASASDAGNPPHPERV